jgi:magnesium and cobalt transporter
MEIDDLNHLLGIEIRQEDINIINGLLSSRLGKIPERGESVEVEGYVFTVEKCSRRRAQLVRIRKME